MFKTSIQILYVNKQQHRSNLMRFGLTFREYDSIYVPGQPGGVCLQVLGVTCVQRCYLDTVHVLSPYLVMVGGPGAAEDCDV